MAQAQAFRQADPQGQLALRGLGGARRSQTIEQGGVQARVDARTRHTPMCAGCRAKEARYGFRPKGVEIPGEERPRTLCFDCFRVELDRRRRVAAQLAKGWNASQEDLPLEDTLNELSLRRRRAQIAARHALGL